MVCNNFSLPELTNNLLSESDFSRLRRQSIRKNSVLETKLLTYLTTVILGTFYSVSRNIKGFRTLFKEIQQILKCQPKLKTNKKCKTVTDNL